MREQTDIPDSELLDAWREGDKRSGNNLIRRHIDSVRHYLSRFASKDVVDDVVAQTFENIARYRASIHPVTSMRSYVLSIARHTLYRHLNNRHAVRISEGGAFENIADPDLDPERSVIAANDIKLLYRALRELPLDEQITLELFIWEEFSAPEIAEIMNASLPQVKHRIRRGRDKLEALVIRFQMESGQNGVDAEELSVWFASLRQSALALSEK